MSYLPAIIFLFCSALVPACSASAAGTGEAAFRVHHDLTVAVHPSGQSFSATDTITFTGDLPPELAFRLHKGLSPSSATPEASLVRTIGPDESLFEMYTVTLPAGLNKCTITYGGRIYHPVAEGAAQARGIASTPGIISEEGVYLSGSSFWYPVFPVRLITFTLDIRIPEAYDAVSQGERTIHETHNGETHVSWNSPELQDEIFLVASGFTLHAQTFSVPSGKVVSAMAYLRSDDRKLARKYLDATVQYVRMYENLIGEYPYRKFALVENFWETGFGMPSFTLLGPSVIRLPFIINSSYPHEILHNWFGNAVFPEYAQGNWSEGLTAYLSDHLLREQQGGASDYRFTTLQKYADYALKERDFPLLEFRSRHSASSEAVGYGKAMMFFHMLRRDLGDEVFTEALRDFYRAKRFQHASFHDLKAAFEKASGRDLSRTFTQWLERSGAPELELAGISFQRDGERYFLEGKIVQVQDGEAYELTVPLAVTVEESDQAVMIGLTMSGRELDFSVPLKFRPLRVDVDPESDIFRRLHRSEIPSAISQILGAERLLIILPATVPEEMRKAYIDLSVELSRSAEGIVSVAGDNELAELPKNTSAVVLGWENRFSSEFLEKVSPSVQSGRDSIVIDRKSILKNTHSVVLMAQEPENRDYAVMLIAAPRPSHLQALGRKLPHYHKYSYLAFEGEGAENVLKGRWPVLRSPLMAHFPGRDGGTALPERGKFWPREPLASLPPVFSAARMMETVNFLADESLEGRGFGTEGLEKAAGYIAEKFREAGLSPGGHGQESYVQTWEGSGGDPEQKTTLQNVIGFIPGNRPDFAGQSIVIGAHYDHLGRGWPDVREGNRGSVHPGADDNASGVAVLIELAGVLAKNLIPDRNIVFAAFTAEEAGRQGSRFYVKEGNPFPAGRIVAMLNLDTIGRLGNRKILVLGASTAREWPHIFRGAGYVTGAEIDVIKEQLDASDNVSFAEAGIPAVQLFSGPHQDYHRPSDTDDKVDAEGLVRVAAVVKEAVEYLAGRETPLSLPGEKNAEESPHAKTDRKVTLGTIPDYAFTGSGCRLTGVLPGSPAETCGLREGDIITMINEKPVRGLRGFAETLSWLQPGSRITITFVRSGEILTTEAVLTPR